MADLLKAPQGLVILAVFPMGEPEENGVSKSRRPPEFVAGRYFSDSFELIRLELQPAQSTAKNAQPRCILILSSQLTVILLCQADSSDNDPVGFAQPAHIRKRRSFHGQPSCMFENIVGRVQFLEGAIGVFKGGRVFSLKRQHPRIQNLVVGRQISAQAAESGDGRCASLRMFLPPTIK